MDLRLLNELTTLRQAATDSTDSNAINKLHTLGKLTARERIALLLDSGSFVEMGQLGHSAHPDLKDRTPADGVVIGHGKIDGRIVYVSADDGTILGGTRGRVGEIKLSRIRAAALKHKKPFIALMEAGAARVQESFGAMAANMGARFGDHFRMSGRVPQVGAVLGPAFGGPSFTAAQSDFTTLAAGTGFMGMSGPLVVKIGIKEEVTSDAIGGAEMSGTITGQADHIGETEAECLSAIRSFLSYLPSNCDELAPLLSPRTAELDSTEGKAKLRDLIPELGRQAYDMRRVLSLIVDGGELLHLRPKYGPNLITAFGRMEGQSVGFIASNPAARGGVLDQKAANKARKFVDLCNAFHIPLVFVCDAPGFLVGPEIEKQRMVSLAARWLNSVCGADVPKITIVARKAIGLAYIALCGRAMNPDTIVAWPGAHFVVMGPEACLEIVYGKAIRNDPDPELRRSEIVLQMNKDSSAFQAAAMGLIDDVIDPGDTRKVILESLAKTAGAIKPQFKHRIDP